MAEREDAYTELVRLLFSEMKEKLPDQIAREFIGIYVKAIRDKFPDETYIRSRLEQYKSDPAMLLREFDIEQAMQELDDNRPSVRH